MARIAATTKKRKRKGSFTRRKSSTSSNRVGGSIITAGEALFLACGVGLGVLAWQFLKPKTDSSTNNSLTPNNTGNPLPQTLSYCTLQNETVERRINGGCGCSSCRSVNGRPQFNFKSESF